MSLDITLSAAVFSTLLFGVSNTDFMERMQNRLSTGLKVVSAVDDLVVFFLVKTWNYSGKLGVRIFGS